MVRSTCLSDPRGYGVGSVTRTVQDLLLTVIPPPPLILSPLVPRPTQALHLYP